MYGSSLRIETRSPRALRMRPIEAVTIPLPTELTTPPVTKMYLGMEPRRDGESAGDTPDLPGARATCQTMGRRAVARSSAVRRSDGRCAGGLITLTRRQRP